MTIDMLDRTLTSAGGSYESFFQKATCHPPYPHQVRFGFQPLHDCIIVCPTASGKTASVVIPWLWHLVTDRHHTPTRLLYCLPMRSLVRQIAREVEKWLKNLGCENSIDVFTLLGGKVEQGWETSPERPAIIVATQDLAISRQLNRGYAMSRFKWPVHFGLLNNDVLVVLDEVQLMGAGILTSVQLAAFRRVLGTFGPAYTVCMSATLDPALLATPDFAPHLERVPVFRIASDELTKPLARRLQARKSIARAPLECRTPEGLARFVGREHRPGTQTLVVVNRVERAIDVYRALDESFKDAERRPELLLLHSRFRPGEREPREVSLDAPPGTNGRIIASTQVIEAGVDITSELLMTDLAPYSSLVQRFGRCNRDGMLDAARIFWVDRPVTARQSKLAEPEVLDEKQLEEVARPYTWAELEEAAQLIGPLKSAAPVDLPAYQALPSQDDVLRRRDLIDLFDTSRDLSGFDIDISRFVRGGEERDVFVAWRTANEKGLLRTCRPEHEELCPVPLGEFRDLIRKAAKGKLGRTWCWDSLDGTWVTVSAANLDVFLRPGALFVLDSAAGGYDSLVGWSAVSPAAVTEVPPAGESELEDSMDADHPTRRKYRQTLAAHASEVREAVREILRALENSELDPYEEELLYAALHHDIGKAHAVFQESLEGKEGRLLAKNFEKKRCSRRYFRHELASALVLLSAGASDLAAYLAAAHHGKVRLAIRSLPSEQPPTDPEVRFARGIHEGDRLPAIDLGEAKLAETVLQLEPMLLGGREQLSWTERMIRVRDRLGPFRLAYLEAMLRVADWRASENPKETEASA